MNIVNNVGRVVACRSSRFSSNPEETEAAVKADVYSLAVSYHQVYSAGVVEPAPQQIMLELTVRT